MTLHPLQTTIQISYPFLVYYAVGIDVTRSSCDLTGNNSQTGARVALNRSLMLMRHISERSEWMHSHFWLSGSVR